MRVIVIVMGLVILAGCGTFQDDDPETSEPAPTEEQSPDEESDIEEAASDSDEPEESEEASSNENEPPSAETTATSPATPESTLGASNTASSEADAEQQDSLCNPPLQLLPCPRTYTDDELRATVGDAISWLFDAEFDKESVERDNHPFLSEPYPDGLRTGGWAFDTRSQVFACLGVRPNSPPMFPERLQGELVCYHSTLGGQPLVVFPCDRVELNGLLCWRERDGALETSHHAMVCTPLPFLKEYLEPGDFVGFYAECGPLAMP